TPTATPTPTHIASEGSVALTFDAGADRGYAEDILNILQDEHIVAGFGVTGQWAHANPDLVRRMAADGHLVFNHTLDLRSFTGVSDSLGWRGTPSADIVTRCLRLAAPGAVYVFHVGHASQDAIALPQIIRGLRDRGFGFQRVD